MIGRRRLPERSSLEFNLTSMIDVVFQLLIYFIVGTTFAMDEESYRMDLPDRRGDAAMNSLSLEDEPIVIRVYQGGQLSVPGPWTGPRRVDTLGEFLTSQRMDRGGLIPTTAEIRIAPLADVPWGDAVEVFNVVLAAGYESVGFEEAQE